MPLPSDFRGKPSAEMALFTNREQHQQLFSHKVNLPAGAVPRIPAVMLFGPGGIGKSWLLRRLETQIRSNDRSIPSIRIDFTLEGASNRLRDDPTAALATIRQITVAKCPSFDLAYGYLLVRKGFRDEAMLDDPVRRVGAAVANEGVRLALGLIPVIGASAQAFYSVIEKLYPYVRETFGLADLMHRDLRLLQASTVVEIEGSLVRRLVDDLKTAFPVRNDHAVQAVVFVDTVEALQPMDSTMSNLEIRTHWLRELIRGLNDRVLFVLGGQNRLTWQRIHPDWREPAWLEQYPVDGLSKEDAREFLQKCRFEDPSVQEAMLSACQTRDGTCHTFHLGLLADLAWVEREVNQRIVTPALFSSLPLGDWTELALRFLRSLPQQAHEHWIRKLSLTPEFDEAAARACHFAQNYVFQDADWQVDWQMLRSFSFLVSIEDKPGWWTIHSTMQRAINEDLALLEPDLGRILHQSWHSYWRTRSSQSTDVYAELAWYHHWHLDKVAAVQGWKQLIETARTSAPVDMVSHYLLLSWLEPLRLLEKPNWREVEAQAGKAWGKEYLESSLGDRGENLRKAIELFQNALKVQTRTSLPEDWAQNENHLGFAWANRPDGDRVENMREAIACFERSLEVITQNTSAPLWAEIQTNLGDAWRDRPDGNPGDNLRKAIVFYRSALNIRTKESRPREWALTQRSLGLAWWSTPDGSREENLRKAISCYQNALSILTPEKNPQDWAATQNYLGLACRDRREGKLRNNFLEAIAYYESALGVLKRESYPRGWAETMHNLGNAWRDLPTGIEDNEEENFGKAKACYERALQVMTRELHPQTWVALQNDLGRALQGRPAIDRDHYLRDAIACYENVLKVWTRERYAGGWAAAQHNLGNAWRDRTDGNPDERFQKAIACYRCALQVQTKESSPQEWAITQRDFGDAWLNRKYPIRRENLLEAIACYQRALEFWTRESHPMWWTATQKKLDHALSLLDEPN